MTMHLKWTDWTVRIGLYRAARWSAGRGFINIGRLCIWWQS